jgi:hypothetical protein
MRGRGEQRHCAFLNRQLPSGRSQAMYNSAQGLRACLTQRRARVDTKVQLHVSFQIEVAVTRPNCVESFDYVVALAVYSRDWFS